MHFFSTLLVLLPIALEVSAIAVPSAHDHALLARGRARVNNNKNKNVNKNVNKNNNNRVVKTNNAATAANNATAAAAGAGAGAAGSTTAATQAGQTSSSGTNATIGTDGNPDAQDSLTLQSSQIGNNTAADGQAIQEAGQVPSLTSENNFINFCLTQGDVPITDGTQITTGSCNPITMGRIVAKNVMPSAKFQFPVNGQTIQANHDFTIKLNVNNMNTGNFVNANSNYFGAPCQVDASGQVIAHSHVVVEQVNGFDDKTPTDPTKFAFFKGLNDKAAGGVLSADVAAGLPAGTYKVSSINTCANHQPVLVAVAQHGSLDDAVYFNVQ